jgi:hypothetical protein
MSVTRIIQALRRPGTPSQRNALRRQDEYLEGREVSEHSLASVDTPQGKVQSFRATVDAVDETVTAVDAQQQLELVELAAEAQEFLAEFGDDAAADELARLDAAFAAWLHADDRLGYGEEDVVLMLGARFGAHCAEGLKMRWVLVEDAGGTAMALDGVEREFRAYRFHSIRKRIADHEHDYFRAVHAMLAEMSRSARLVGSTD